MAQGDQPNMGESQQTDSSLLSIDQEEFSRMQVNVLTNVTMIYISLKLRWSEGNLEWAFLARHRAWPGCEKVSSNVMIIWDLGSCRKNDPPSAIVFYDEVRVSF